MADTRWFTTYNKYGGNNSTHRRRGAIQATDIHLRLRSRASRKASTKAMVENTPEILSRS